MEDFRFPPQIATKVEDGLLWVCGADLVNHLHGASWGLHNDGAVEDAAVMALIGQWLEACVINAMTDTVMDAVVTDGPDAAAALVMDFLSPRA